MGQSHTSSGETTAVVGLTTCPRCCIQTEPDDQFCQDCGFHLSAGKKLKPAAPIELKAVLTCLNCGAQHEDATQYCESCGSRMSDMGVYTTSVRAISLGPTTEHPSSAAVRLASSLRPPSPQSIRSSGPSEKDSSQPDLHPAIEARNRKWRAEMLASINGNGNHPRAAGGGLIAKAKLPSLTPRVSLKDLRRFAMLPNVPRWALDGATGLVLLTFCVSLIWWLANLDSQTSPSGPRAGFIKASTALAAGRFDETIVFIEKLNLERDGALTVEERRVLNEALYKRAKAKANKSDYKGAVADLLRLSPEFADYAESKVKLAEYLKLADEDGSAKGKKSEAASPKESKSHSTKSETTTAPSSDANETGETKAVPGQEPSAQSTDKTSTDTTSSKPEPSTQSSYTDDDVRRYHRLLEGFFTASKTRASQPESSEFEIGAGPIATNAEPPTLQEWLQQGKPEF